MPISRTGKYLLYPIAGTLMGFIGMLLLTRITLTSPTWQLYLFTAVSVWGLGLVMQVLVPAVQYPGQREPHGVATPGHAIPLDWRSIGVALLARCLPRCYNPPRPTSLFTGRGGYSSGANPVRHSPASWRPSDGRPPHSVRRFTRRL